MKINTLHLLGITTLLSLLMPSIKSADPQESECSSQESTLVQIAYAQNRNNYPCYVAVRIEEYRFALGESFLVPKDCMDEFDEFCLRVEPNEEVFVDGRSYKKGDNLGLLQLIIGTTNASALGIMGGVMHAGFICSSQEVFDEIDYALEGSCATDEMLTRLGWYSVAMGDECMELLRAQVTCHIIS